MLSMLSLKVQNFSLPSSQHLFSAAEAYNPEMPRGAGYTLPAVWVGTAAAVQAGDKTIITSIERIFGLC